MACSANDDEVLNKVQHKMIYLFISFSSEVCVVQLK